MTAAHRIATLDDLPANDLCVRAETALTALVEVMNAETTLLRAGRFREAGTLTAEKTALAQDYVSFARSVQRQLPRLKIEAPQALVRLQSGHERLATQMAENLRVIATARNVTEDLLADVSAAVGRASRAKTYGASGVLNNAAAKPASGIAVNRAL